MWLRTAYLTGSKCINQGSLALNLGKYSRRSIREETQEYGECEVADEPVVVMKFWPVKPGNSVEDKTRTMLSGVSTISLLSKDAI